MKVRTLSLPRNVLLFSPFPVSSSLASVNEDPPRDPLDAALVASRALCRRGLGVLPKPSPWLPPLPAALKPTTLGPLRPAFLVVEQERAKAPWMILAFDSRSPSLSPPLPPARRQGPCPPNIASVCLSLPGETQSTCKRKGKAGASSLDKAPQRAKREGTDGRRTDGQRQDVFDSKEFGVRDGQIGGEVLFPGSEEGQDHVVSALSLPFSRTPSAL